MTDTTLRDGSDESISQSSTAASTSFRFDSEMDQLWINCEWLASGETYTNTQVDRLPEHSSAPVKPFHLALGLLFDGLKDDEDQRLYATELNCPGLFNYLCSGPPFPRPRVSLTILSHTFAM